MMNRYICMHGHFYQPPRENPWLEEIEMQDSAAPYHDWNERIAAECYEPNAASRILDQEKKIIGIVNNYSRMSFDFGPSLISWIKKKKPEVYEAIVEADRISAESFGGHGSAIAQVYNHMIMPLADSRDKLTQVKWGMRDFRSHFGRLPEGMWLPETAVDTQTLEVLAGEGIRFTILSPYQAGRIRRIGEKDWIDVRGGKINPRMLYLCNLPSGKSINLFFYDGAISHELSFGRLLNDGKTFADRLVGGFTGEDVPQLVHTAIDGETYGHHRRFGDMALAFCLHYIEANKLARLTNHGEYLEKFPPSYEVEILENSSWSCSHGVERWRENCGCNTGLHPGWNQRWRAPLRAAMDWLRESITPLYERELSLILKDPWLARDDYIDVILDRSEENVERYLDTHAAHSLSPEEKTTAMKLLEMQRAAMLMYTSCGWFFDDISGIETIQILRYAARAIQLAEDVGGVKLEPEFLRLLSKAKSNVQGLDNGANVYEKFVKPVQIDLLDVGVHYAISSLFYDYPRRAEVYCYMAENLKQGKIETGRLKLITGQARISSRVVLSGSVISYAVLHLGDHNLSSGVRENMGEEAFLKMESEIRGFFERGDIPGVIRKIDRYFGEKTYTLGDLFRDEQRKVLTQILKPTIDEIEDALNQTYENYYPIMKIMNEMNLPLPEAFSVIGQLILNNRIQSLLEEDRIDIEELRRAVEEIKRFSFTVYKRDIGYTAGRKVTILMEELSKNPDDLELIRTITSILEVIRSLTVELNLWRAQNLYFDLCERYRNISELGNGEKQAKEWLSSFARLGEQLSVRCT